MKIQLDLFMATPVKSKLKNVKETVTAAKDTATNTATNTSKNTTTTEDPTTKTYEKGTGYVMDTTPGSIYGTGAGLFTTANINDSGEFATLLEQAGYSGDYSNGFSGIKNWVEGEGIDLTNTYNNTIGAETINALKKLAEKNQQPTYQSFDYGVAPTFTDNWSTLKEQLANAALNMNYEDYLNSDAYKALQQNYIYNGNKSMSDSLGQASARTGGLASTYAQTAAQQSYNDYMTQLQDVARSAYEQEFADAAQKAEMAYGYSDNDYNRYLNDLAQWNTDRSFAYQVLSDTIGQSQYNQEWQNTLERQKVADAQQTWENNYNTDALNYEKETTANNTAYDRALEAAQLSGNYSAMKNYGWTTSMIKSAQNQWVADNTKSSSGGTKSDGAKKTDSTKPALTAAQSTSALEKGEITETTLNAYKYWKGETDLYKSALKQYLSEYINGAKKIMNSSKSKDGSGISYLENLTEKGIISETYAQFIMDVLGI